MDKIYLDYAASTPVLKEVVETMEPYFYLKYGNPGSLHSLGQEALLAIDESRNKIAQSISASFNEIIFTSGATEANNLTLRGVVKNFKKNKGNSPANNSPAKILISAIEHESVIQTAFDLEREGIEVKFIPVDKNGKIKLDYLKENLDHQTLLVSIMYVNNEIGTIEDIAKVATIIREFKKTNNSKHYPLLHSDAAQALTYLDINVKMLGVDLMTLSSQKIYGPKGVGALYISSQIKHLISPTITGGVQEFTLRAGTENVPAIVGFAKAVEIISKNKRKNVQYVNNLKKYFWHEIKKIYKKASINGTSEIPHILNINIKEEITADFLIALDMVGICASHGSACTARAFEPSHVLKALGMREEDIRSSIRFSFGITTTKKEIREAIKRIKSIKNNKKGA